MIAKTLSPKLLSKIDVYWRAANYLSVGQIYLYDNSLLKRQLMLADVRKYRKDAFYEIQYRPPQGPRI